MPYKILFLSHSFFPNIGGIEVNSEILAQAFYEAGHDVRMVTWSINPEKNFFPYTVIRQPNNFQLFKEHAWADVIFENNPCLRLGWPNLFLKKPSVIALNTWISRTDGTFGWQDKIKMIWLKRAKEVIAVSIAIRNRCWSNATVIANPYRVNDFNILSEVPRTLEFVFLGRLVSDKGADLAINALHKILASSPYSTPKTYLTIVGDGPERENLEKLVSKLELVNMVRFVGPLRGEALNLCLNQHRFILVPSVWEEPFGNVALEGMACGCIPIVADCGGLPEAIGKAGLTFIRGDVDSLVSSIREVAQNITLEQHLLKEAKNHLKAHHPQKVSHKYLQVIDIAVTK